MLLKLIFVYVAVPRYQERNIPRLGGQVVGAHRWLFERRKRTTWIPVRQVPRIGRYRSHR